MQLPTIKIKLDARGIGTIEVDGHKITNVANLSVRIRHRKTYVFLQMIGAVDIEVEPSAINAELLGLPVTIVRGAPKK